MALLIRRILLFAAAAGYGWLENLHAEPLTLPVTLPPVVVLDTNVNSSSEMQNTPQSLTALPEQSLQDSGISSTLELQRLVPNFTMAQAGLRSFSDNYTLRGLGNTEFLSAPAVVLYVDDAPFGDTMAYTTDLLAVDRVEVFRGPQGSRFGKNSEAGVINIVTRQPTNHLEGEASVSVASFNTEQFQAALRGPLVKGKLFFGLAGQYSRSDGFIRNTFLNKRADASEGINGRASLRWIPNDIWEVNFTATADHFDDGSSVVSLSGDPHKTASELDPRDRRDVNSQALRVRGTFPKITVTAITTRQDSRLNPFTIDPDFSPLTGNTGRLRHAQIQWSEELRLQPSVPCDRWDWHAGFFFATADTDIHRPFDYFIPTIPLVARDVINSRQTVNNYALLGELTRYLGTKWETTLGLRLDYTTANIGRTRLFSLGSPPPVNADAGFFNAAPKFTLAYHATDTVLFYGNTGLGFKPGGFSPLIDPPRSPKYETETVWASEVGVKSSWLNDKLTANLSLFYYDIRNYQVEQIVPPGFDNTIVNAPHARSLGAELELTAHPADGWEISGFIGSTDVQLERYTDPFTGASVRNTHPPFVADFNAGVALQYQHPRGWFARLGATFLGDTYADAANTPAFKQSAYALLSARIGYEREHLGIFLFGENLGDAGYYTKKIYSLNGGAPGSPQTFGVTATVKF